MYVQLIIVCRIASVRKKHEALDGTRGFLEPFSNVVAGYARSCNLAKSINF